MTAAREADSRIVLRDEPRPDDASAVHRILASSGFFHSHELDVAVELVRERLERGLASGYRFLFAEERGTLVGYTCYGEIACTRGSFDLYWIAVESARRGKGLGQWLLTETETAIAGLGGRRIYVETSSRELYAPTRAFYSRCGYVLEATLADFYAPGDSKLIYVRALSA